jgi:hypothetical protein
MILKIDYNNNGACVSSSPRKKKKRKPEQKAAREGKREHTQFRLESCREVVG